jgi:hypothetical protein
MLTLAKAVILRSVTRGALAIFYCLRFEPPPNLEFRVRVRFSLQLVVYRQTILLGAKPLQTHGQNFFPTEHMRF